MKGAPKHDTSSKHGTNKNYQKSGPPIIMGGLSNMFGGGGGRGGSMKSIIDMIRNRKNPSQPAAAVATPPPATPAEPAAGAPAPPMDPNAQEMTGAPMYGKKKGAPKYKSNAQRKAVHASKKDGGKGAPKLKGNQHKIDKNKDGKISKADFDMMKPGAPNYKNPQDYKVFNMGNKPTPVTKHKKY